MERVLFHLLGATPRAPVGWAAERVEWVLLPSVAVVWPTVLMLRLT